jgi:hypothetical protein
MFRDERVVAFSSVMAPRQLRLHCSSWLHPRNDAKTTLPPSMAGVCHGRIKTSPDVGY